MTIELSIMTLFFLALLIHTTIKFKQGFEVIWSLLRRYFLIALPIYLITWDIHFLTRIIAAIVIIGTILSEFFKVDKKYRLGLNILNILIIIWMINGLPAGVSPKTYIGISFTFGAFFISFFDSILVFKPKWYLRLVFLSLGHILMFHCVWSTYEMEIGMLS